ncbi:Piwi domain-containing protein [Xanthomarina sp. F2636L]|uniref:Piwi domain-containing protein n=1 Tax=Xanthomarina sp. F2636L TaxID=2996018 RepID=UPI00225E0ACA|nr:Piwi domain-containing protein [Xanthomarina sp. F2636L]MCX7549925.1 Piwi domain-containing protein [Xanthomarina sp. F2636L]
MSQELYFNIITFDLPDKPITFYFSKEKIGNAQKLYKTKFPTNIEDLFPGIKEENPDFIYTSFIYEKEGYLPLKLNLKEQPTDLIKHYYNWRIKKYFKSINKLVDKNFVKDNQIWVGNKLYKNNNFYKYFKFTVKVQIKEVSEYGELVVSYDGMAKVFKKPISEIIKYTSTTNLNNIIYKKRILKYHKDKQYIEDNTKAYAVLNNDLRNAFKIKPEPKDDSNKYINYKQKIDKFIQSFILSDDFKAIIAVNNDDYLPVEINRIREVDDICNELVFQDGVGRVPKSDFRKLKPLNPCQLDNVHFFFIHHTSYTKEVATLQKLLEDGTSWYKGLNIYAGVLAHFDNSVNIIFDDLENPLPQIKDGIKKFKSDPNINYVAIYLSPFNKHEPNLEKKLVYYKVKEQLLYKRIISQVIDFDRFRRNQHKFIYDLTNISLALLAKLDGTPWQLNVKPKNELVIGVGAFKNTEENIRYVASAFSFKNNGRFNEFHYFSKSDVKQLGNALSDAIYQYVPTNKTPEKIVIHFYKDMKDEEIQPVLEMMDKLKLPCPLFVLNINKTKSEDIIAFDQNWNGELIPISGTYINIGPKDEHKYLLFNNLRYKKTVQYPSYSSYAFPIKLKISSPTPEALNDSKMIRKLIEQVYQFSRLYWKSLRQQNVPITIKYPEMVAEIAPRFESKEIPPFGQETLWFL